MNPERTERRLAAILSADAVGYSRLMAHDEVATLETLKTHRDAMTARIRQHGGRVVDAVGDNLLAEFPSIVDAVACAVEVQRELETRNAEIPEDRRMLFRLGLNLGDVIVQGDRILGDGVNVAARLEALAEHGGICISGTAFDQIEGKLELDLEALGEQSLKNIPKPVRVYRVRPPRALAACTRDGPCARVDLGVPGFAGQPAIAVLAFDNISADPEHQYFADGIAEDLITRLSSCKTFPVIARNSTFVYKDKPVDVMQVSEELGARYVVEGSVQKSENRVRISAQLIDGTTGQHVWAERYDRDLEDLFAIQDEITQTIVASINPALLRFEEERAARKEPRNLDAWDCTARGFWHLWRYTREDNATARVLFEQAIELDSHFAVAFSGLAMTHYLSVYFQWTDAPAQAVAEMTQAALESVSLDDQNPYGHLILGWACSLTGQRDKTIAAFERAVQIDPSFAFGYYALGIICAFAARPEDGIVNLQKAMRLSPHDPLTSFFFLGMSASHFAAAQYDEAADWAKRSIQRRALEPAAYRYLAASYAHLDREDEARSTLREMYQLDPNFSLATDRVVLSTADSGFVKRLFDGLRKAGLKE